VHLGLEPLGERVDAGDADAVEAARDLVGALVELAAGVQHGQDDLERGLAAEVRRQLRVLHRVDRDARAVVLNGDRVALMDRDGHARAAAGQDLVDGVVDDLVNQVVQAGRAGAADVHRRAFAHGLQAFEDLDL